MDRKMVNALIAEFLGTFALVFIGSAVVSAVTVTDTTGALLNPSVVIPAFGHGLIVLGLAFAFGSVSGGHFNPAVTVALLVAGKVPLMKAILYMVAQFVGAIIAALVISSLLATAPSRPFGQAIGALTEPNLMAAVILEAIATFLFITVIYQVAVNGKAGAMAPIAIGLTLTAIILAIGLYSGASVNPARTLGPALAAGDLSYVPGYFIGIFGGGILAGLFNGYLYKPDVAA